MPCGFLSSLQAVRRDHHATWQKRYWPVETRFLIRNQTVHLKSGIREMALRQSGRYIIESGVFAQLGTQDRGAGNEVQLTDALARQIGEVPFHGFRFSGERFDCGSKIGFLQANIAFAMSRDDLAEPLASWIKNRMAIY